MIPPAVSPSEAQFVLSSFAVLAIEKAKSDKGLGKYLPFIRRETDRLNRIVAVAISFAGSVGIGVTFKAGVLTVTNLTFATLVSIIVFFGRSLAGQELIYRVVKISGHLSELAETFAVLSSTTPQSGDPSAGDPRESWHDVEQRIAAERAAESPKKP